MDRETNPDFQKYRATFDKSIRTTETTGTNVMTETTAIGGTIAANGKALMKANSSIIEVHVGVLVGAIVATIFIITLVYPISPKIRTQKN